MSSPSPAVQRRRAIARCARASSPTGKQRPDEPGWFNGAVPSFGDARRAAPDRWPGAGPARGPTGPAGRSPATTPATCSTRRCSSSASPRAPIRREPDDGSTLVDCMITNAVRCVPPENKPTPAEIATCRPYFAARAGALCRRLKVDPGARPHRPRQTLDGAGAEEMRRSPSRTARATSSATRCRVLYDSFHCSRYNTNTGRLTPAMFRSVFAAITA